MKHWVFDLDGTLVDSFPPYFECLREIFAEHGIGFDEEARHLGLSIPVALLFERKLGAAHVARAMDRLQLRSNEDAKTIRPFDGAAELLAELRSRGRKIAIWTNRDRVSSQLILQHSGLEKHVDFVVTGGCVSRRKPDSEGLGRISLEFDTPAAELTVVGDHESDIVAARDLGARAIRAAWHGHFPLESCRLAHGEFTSLSDLRDWMRAQPA